MCVLLTRNNLVHQFKSLRTLVGDTYYVIHDSYNVGFAVIHWSSSLSQHMSVHMCACAHTRTHTRVRIQRKKRHQNIVFLSAVFIVDQTSSTFRPSELIAVMVT